MVDDAIVARAAAGDADSFRVIVECYEPRIFRFLYGLVRDRELARDLTQETFLSAYLAIGRTGADLKLAAWLYTIARNHAVSELRRRRLVSWVPLHSPRDGDETADEPRSPGETMTADQVAARQAVHDLLARVDVESRTLLLLTVEGFTYKEIGQMVHLSEPAVRQRVFRARERLRTLRRDWVDQDGSEGL